MKRLLILAILACAVTAQAATVELNFAWDANTEPDLDLYTLHRGTTSGGPYTAVLDIDAPAVSTAYNLTGNYGQTFFFVLTASDTTGNRSGYSNQVSYTLVAPDTTPPAAPKNFKAWLARIIQAVMDWMRGGMRVG
jgi:hypothetical protein